MVSHLNNVVLKDNYGRFVAKNCKDWNKTGTHLLKIWGLIHGFLYSQTRCSSNRITLIRHGKRGTSVWSNCPQLLSPSPYRVKAFNDGHCLSLCLCLYVCLSVCLSDRVVPDPSQEWKGVASWKLAGRKLMTQVIRDPI